MSDEPTSALADALAAANDYLTVLSRHRHGDAGSTDPALLGGGPEARRLFAIVQSQPPEVGVAVEARLATGLVGLPDPWVAGLLAIQLGSMVENGSDPVPLAEALRARLPADLAAARRFVERLETETGVRRPDEAEPATLAALGRRDPIGASAWAALEINTPAAMAAWCRHRPSRLAAKTTPGLADDASFLGSRGGYCHYVGDLLAAADGVEVTVIAPEQRKGFVVDLEVVRCAAHLFALLEDILVGDPDQGLLTGPRTDPNVAAIARGVGEARYGEFFDIGWHYEYWFGLHPEAAGRARGLHPMIAAMIGVEATVHDLPTFRGRPVILMRPGVFGLRSCELSFFAPLHGDLRSRVTILRYLSSAEVDMLCDDLRAEAETLG